MGNSESTSEFVQRSVVQPSAVQLSIMQPSIVRPTVVQPTMEPNNATRFVGLPLATRMAIILDNESILLNITQDIRMKIYDLVFAQEKVWFHSSGFYKTIPTCTLELPNLLGICQQVYDEGLPTFHKSTTLLLDLPWDDPNSPLSVGYRPRVQELSDGENGKKRGEGDKTGSGKTGSGKTESGKTKSGKTEGGKDGEKQGESDQAEGEVPAEGREYEGLQVFRHLAVAASDNLDVPDVFLERGSKLRHISLRHSEVWWGPLGIKFDKPINTATGVHEDAQLAVTNSILEHRAICMIRIMVLMRTNAVVVKGQAGALSVSLKAVTQNQPGKLQYEVDYEKWHFELILTNDDLFTLKYRLRDVDYEVVQEPKENVWSEAYKERSEDDIFRTNMEDIMSPEDVVGILNGNQALMDSYQ